MRIIKVSVTKLFGIFDHEIPLNQDRRITIMHGPNGVGKTVLFRMIHGLFNYRYQVFSEIPFDEFTVTFDTGAAVFVRKDDTGKEDGVRETKDASTDSGPDREKESSEFWIGFFDGKREDPEKYIPQKGDSELSRELLRMIHTATPLERIDEDLWIDVESEDTLTLRDIFERYDSIAKEYWTKEPSWFEENVECIRTRFIQTQRLQQGLVLPDRFAFRYVDRRESSRSPNLTVEKYSQNIKRDIRNVSTKYAEQSQQIDRVFPHNLDKEWRRLKEPNTSPKYEQDKLEDKLATLEDKRTELMRLGLFEGLEAPPLVDVHEELAGVFSIYVDDVEGKFSVFDEISKQLKILTDLINDRFQHKHLTIDKKRGFVIRPLDKDGKPQSNSRIPTTSLSSGEQHQLVLFYEMLFDIKSNSLILIDEPEISLHVTWQERFLEDIERASEGGGYDILVATHSPDVIGDRQDWMVGLGGPEMA